MNYELSLPKKLAAVFAVIALISFYLFFPLNWGLMDDSEYVLVIQKHLQSGWLVGTWKRFLEHAELDLRTGIFRPSFWWYTALAYQLPVRIAYFTRLLEYLAVLAAAYFLLRKAFQKYSAESRGMLLSVSLLAILSIRALYEGIFLFSLQEFSGLFFLSLAYGLYGGELRKRVSSGRLLAVVALLILGIGFKPPFVWLYFLFAIGLFLHERRRVSGILLFIFGIAYFAFTIRLAQTGFYSQQIYQFGVARMVQSVLNFVKHSAPVALAILISGLALFRFGFSFSWRPSLSRVQWIGLQLLLAGAMYMATLLPRGIEKGYGYYFGPPIFLLALGFFLSATILIGRVEKKSGASFRLGRWAVVAIAAVIFLFSLKSFVQRNLGVQEFKRWARENDRAGIVLATNSGEVMYRLKEIYFLNFGEEWKGEIKNLTHDTPVPEGATHYLVFSDQVPPKNEAMGNLIWRKGSAELVEIKK